MGRPRQKRNREDVAATGSSWSENALRVWRLRFLDEEETPEDRLRLVAMETSYKAALKYGLSEEEARRRAEELYQLMVEKKFMFNSPTIRNAGRDPKLSKAACFVIPLGDSMPEIFDAVKTAALIQQAGGGVGADFTPLRPKGDIIASTGGKSSGPVGFMRIFDAAAEEIKQGGVRRGAWMFSLRANHPDIEEFVATEFKNANTSVSADDRFMRKVTGEDPDPSWELVNPRDGKVWKVVDAKDLFQKIVKRAHATGNPGLLFLDRINADNPLPQLGPITATNPCVAGDTWVMTGEGPRQVRELVGRPFEAVVNGTLHRTGEEGFFRTATKPVLKLETREGYSLRLTPDHRVLRVVDRTRHRIGLEWVPAGKLGPGDRILLHNHRSLPAWPGDLTEGEGYLLGLLVGDGVLKKDAAVLSVWAKEEAVHGSPADKGAASIMAQALEYAMALPHRSDFTGWVPVAGRNEYRLKSASVKALAERVGMRPGFQTVTPAIERASSEGYRRFLRGLFDCDGTVVGSRQKGVSVRLAQSDLELLRAVQRMLLRLGIASTIYKDRRAAGVRRMPDGKGSEREYQIKAQHELVISGDNLALFAARVGFTHDAKAQKLASLLAAYRRRLNRERFVATVLSVEPDGVEDVFDVQVPGVGAFDAGGIYVHNCGEQPLHPNHACNLGSINLGLYWDTKRRKVKWGELFRDARIATRGLNDVIETAHYPTPEIDKAVRASMQIGLGVMGLADLLIQAELPYDSPEGRRLAARCLRVIRWAARTESRALAQERGTFPLWEGSLWGQKGVPVRNAAMTTVAPTGTIGVLVDASSGIEPLFAVAYIRKTHEGQELKYIHPVFVEVARREGFYSEELMQEVARRGTVVGVPGVPLKWQNIFKGAHDIHWRDHVLMQAELQKYVDNAISKTVNLPHDATEEEIAQAYILAWRTGCKGITVFRDGCRREQVLTITQQPPQRDGGTICVEWGKYVPPALPPEMPARRYYVDTPVGELQLFVVTDEKNRPVEIFGQVGKAGSDINADVEAICRMTSVALRAGIALWYVVKQLHGIGGANAVGFGPKRVRSIADAIGKVLNAHFLNPGAEELTTEGNVITGAQDKVGDVQLDLCPACGNATLVHQDGCRRCLNPDCLYEAC